MTIPQRAGRGIISGIIPLEPGYIAEFDALSKDEWHEILRQFRDVNIYQTWSYDSTRCGDENISHFILRSSGRIIAGAQSRVVRLPFLRIRAAYVRWGPFWRLRDHPDDYLTFRMAVRALRNEYVGRRQMILRLFPALYQSGSPLYLDILKEEGYRHVRERAKPRTLVLDITPPIEVIRKKMDQKWRNGLNRAERNDLEIVEGTEDSLFGDFLDLYRDLLQRKKFQGSNDIYSFRIVQQDLPIDLKMRIFLCRSEGSNTAGAICAAIGESGLYLFGATNERGMDNKGSYLIQRKAIQWMKDRGCSAYDLNGINPVTNPGTYHFKAGLSGKNGKDIQYLGLFDSSPDKMRSLLARAAQMVMPFLKKAQQARGFRGQRSSEH